MEKHFEEVSATLQSYRLEEFLCDTILTVGSNDATSFAKEYRVHSVILAAVSPVFKTAFEDNLTPHWRQIHLPDVNADTMEITLDLIYTGRLVLPITYCRSDRLFSFLETLRDLEITLDRFNGCEFIIRDTDDSEIQSSKQTFVYDESCSNEDVVAMLLAAFSKVSPQVKLSNSSNSSLTDLPRREDIISASHLTEELSAPTEDYDNVKLEDNLVFALPATPDEEVSESLSRHETEHACNKCGQFFVYSDLTSLEMSLTGGRRDWCSKCIMCVTPKFEMAFDLNENSKIYRCSKCPKLFSLQCLLARHEASHDEERAYLCHLCGKAYAQKATLIDHLDVHYGNQHVCFVCAKMFSKASYLRNHMRYHANAPPDTNVTDNGIGAYETSDTEMANTFFCTVCGKHLTSLIGLRQHMKTHDYARPRPFKCSVCVREFSTKPLLTQHTLTHSTAKPHACDKCGKSYKRKQQLVWHSTEHAGEEGCDVTPFKCGICAKTFSYATSYSVHMRTHTGEKPYVCSVCGTAFLQSNHLRVHMRKHTGESPFVCELCPKTYKNRLDLRLHCNRVHQINIAKWRVVNNRKVNTIESRCFDGVV